MCGRFHVRPIVVIQEQCCGAVVIIAIAVTEYLVVIKGIASGTNETNSNGCAPVDPRSKRIELQARLVPQPTPARSALKMQNCHPLQKRADIVSDAVDQSTPDVVAKRSSTCAGALGLICFSIAARQNPTF